MVAPLREEELHAAKTTDIAKTLADRLMLLGRKEVELARAEAQLEVRRGMFLGELAGGTLVLFGCALVCGLVAAILAIGVAWNPIWVALIGLGVFAFAGVAVGLFAAEERHKLKPERSLRQARENVSFARRTASDLRGEPVTT